MTGEAENIYNKARNRKVTKEDWINPIWSNETLTNFVIGGIIGGVTGTARDIKNAKVEAQRIGKELVKYLEKSAKSMKEAAQKGDLETARNINKQAQVVIEEFSNKTLLVYRLNENTKNLLINLWANEANEASILYNPTALNDGTNNVSTASSTNVPYMQGISGFIPGSNKVTPSIGQISSNNANNVNVPQNASNNVSELPQNATNTVQGKVTTPTNKNQNLIQNTKELELKDALNRATTDKNSKGKIILGKVNDFARRKIQQLLGKDVSNKQHVLNDNNIRRILNDHGDPKIESERGQIAVTKEDIQKIPDILENPDYILKGTKNKDGEAVRYVKEYTNNNTFVVEVIPDKSNNLIIKTMWKKPIALADNSMLPASTSKTQGNLVDYTSNKIGSNLPPTTSNSQTSSVVNGGSNFIPTNNIIQSSENYVNNQNFTFPTISFRYDNVLSNQK